MENEENIASPCVRNCCLDEEDICLGCGRTLLEITQWSAATTALKRDIVNAALKRLTKNKKEHNWR